MYSGTASRNDVMTKNSERILGIIERADCHPTAEDIYQEISASESRMVRATVYNNLNALCRAGRVRRVVLEGQPDRFDKTVRHDHLVCSSCGRITDLYLEDLTQMIEEQCGIRISSYDLTISYQCPECQAKVI